MKTNSINERMPLANNGPIAFWSPALVNQMYGEQRFKIDGIERVARSYMGGMFVEYLSISAVRKS